MPKKDAYYFPHDSNAKDDPKCVMLIEQLGLEGYGIYWVLIETLREQPTYKYPVSLIPALARRYNTTYEKMKTVVMHYGLFYVDENEFFSVALMDRMQHVDRKRQQAREAINARWAKQKALPPNYDSNTDVIRTYNDRNSDCNTDVIQVKEREKKEKDLDSLSNDKELSAEPTKKCPFQQILDKYHSICTSFPRVQSLTDSRKKTLQTAWKQGYDVEYWNVIFTKAMQSDFLSGRSGQWTGCGFDWIIKPSNRAKIFEGNYDARQHVREFPF